MASLPYFATCTVCTRVTSIYKHLWGCSLWLPWLFVTAFDILSSVWYMHMTSLLYGFSWFLSFHDHPLVCTSPGLHKNSDVLVIDTKIQMFWWSTIQPPSSVNQFISLTILTIVQPHPRYYIAYYFKDHALNCGWLWCWLILLLPSPSDCCVPMFTTL